MESDEDNNGFEIDRSPGALVWVRRRNGSWWPGRVLGIDELPEICLNMPKSGTPIKLLGKEDGSVDWYNLEKSKRVKPFRCGEYDECIKKAKEHALRSNRKPVVNKGKYVRREDAIVHALDLEEARSLGGNHNFAYGSTSSTVISDKSFGLRSNITRQNEESADVAKKSCKLKKANQKLSQSGIPFVHRCKLSASNMQHMQKKRWKTPNDSEDDATKGMKRMRDLHDLGVGIILKREPNGCVLPDTASLSESDFDNDLSSDTPLNSSRDSCSSLKRKRPNVGQANENSKKKCRRRSLAEFWMDATKVKKPSHHQSTISEESSQGVTDIKVIAENSTSKMEDYPSVTDNSPDCSGTSCEEALLNSHEIAGNAATAHLHSKMKDDLFSDILEFIDNDFSGGFVDVPVMADLPPTLEALSPAKLNSVGEGNQSNHCIQVSLISQLNEGLVEACSTSSSSQINNMGQKIDMGTSEWHTKGKRNVRHLSLNKIVDSESMVYRTNKSETFLLKNKRSSLKETANSTSDESLTSDSSCQQIKCISVSEVRDLIEDQKPKISSINAENVNSTLPTQMALPPRKIRLPSRYRESEENNCCLYDVELNVQSNYQGQRVPLVSLMSKFNGKAIVGHPVTVEVLGTSSIKKLQKDRFPWSNKRPTSGKKLGFSTRKIRRLSSFAVDRKEKGLGRKLVVGKIGGQAVSCIPLRLVFSRLNEALSSSSRSAI
ncbi:uncharacterized protein A4U43_C01F3110 [Asparagus officinalis]|uniref:PWWP domain-containing protein n=1 Tax=Asparagus officinalis TaxID=4686 RepID=A0A5P1FNU6_ASPOF|nr:uncharacterized protein At1g51745 isoform X2 [Asparagus officinalis]ONK79117.1 uncharacterized protein A4U43_C01F3110 [Asparagus officinalis]